MTEKPCEPSVSFQDTCSLMRAVSKLAKVDWAGVKRMILVLDVDRTSPPMLYVETMLDKNEVAALEDLPDTPITVEHAKVNVRATDRGVQVESQVTYLWVWRIGNVIRFSKKKPYEDEYGCWVGLPDDPTRIFTPGTCPEAVQAATSEPRRVSLHLAWGQATTLAGYDKEFWMMLQRIAEGK